MIGDVPEPGLASLLSTALGATLENTPDDACDSLISLSHFLKGPGFPLKYIILNEDNPADSSHPKRASFEGLLVGTDRKLADWLLAIFSYN